MENTNTVNIDVPILNIECLHRINYIDRICFGGIFELFDLIYFTSNSQNSEEYFTFIKFTKYLFIRATHFFSLVVIFLHLWLFINLKHIPYTRTFFITNRGVSFIMQRVNECPIFDSIFFFTMHFSLNPFYYLPEVNF